MPQILPHALGATNIPNGAMNIANCEKIFFRDKSKEDVLLMQQQGGQYGSYSSSSTGRLPPMPPPQAPTNNYICFVFTDESTTEWKYASVEKRDKEYERVIEILKWINA